MKILERYNTAIHASNLKPVQEVIMGESNLIAIRPCVKCGAMDRAPRGDCIPCRRVATATYRIANKEKISVVNASYRAANPEKVKACNAAWVAANTEKVRVAKAVYRAANTDKAKATGAAWYIANQDRALATNAAYRAANRDSRNAAAAVYYAANLDKEKARHADWAKANPEARRVHTQNRKDKKRGNGGILSQGLSAKLFNLQRGKCPCCQQPLGKNFHLDHIMPIALGGSNTDDNIQLLRQKCNSEKHAKHPVDFMQSRGCLL